MWAKPTKQDLERIPKLYKQEGAHTKDMKIYLHFFIGGSDWYVSEYDGKDRFFGFVILGGMEQFAEWGYISFQELKDLKASFMEVDTDKHWTIKTAGKVDKIKDAGGVW